MDEKPPPHVLFFPLPYQGPLNSMFNLAELICLEGLHVTFVVTEYIHRRLLSSSDIQSRFQGYRGFQLQPVDDDLPDDDSRSAGHFTEVLNSLNVITRRFLKNMLTSNPFTCAGGLMRRPVTCIIADGVMGFTFDFAQEIGVPIFYVRTPSPCYLWTSFCLPELIDSGELPPLDTTNYSHEDMDKLVKSVPGTESFLRRRDLPRFSNLGDTGYELLQLLKKEGQENPRARGLILNTFEELDGPLLAHLRATCPNIYAIGPFHAHAETKRSVQTATELTSSSSLWAEDRSALAWLDLHPLKSVIYVSFGSLTSFSEDKLMELWYGVVNSGIKFLWVVRPDSIVVGENWENQIPPELSEATKERGYIVPWAPQTEVLNHPAVGGFLTHSGWNSTLESIHAGVPMLCWPYFLDQQVNSRFVSAVWKVGLDMKDTCDRFVVEKMVRELMELRKEEFSQRAGEMAELGRKCLMEGGSSFGNLQRLLSDIRTIHNQACQ